MAKKMAKKGQKWPELKIYLTETGDRGGMSSVEGEFKRFWADPVSNCFRILSTDDFPVSK